MKWTMMLSDNALQINLTPENDHEREAMKILQSHDGKVTINKGVSVNMCQGGYLRNFGEPAEACVAITITKKD